jgi:hypothetical protein
MEYQVIQSSDTVCMEAKCIYYEGGEMSYEPPLDDDIALDKDSDDTDVYTEPDRMWDDE